MFDEVLISINGKDAAVIGATTLPELGLMEREHLQEWVLSHPELLGAGATVVTSEYDKWQAASGALVADRLDVLALGTDGRLIVVELKRDFAPQTVHMQAVNYAAMVSRLTPRDVAELWSTWHGQDEALDVDSALAELQTKWLLTPDSIKSPRIVLMAADFPASVTASVVWLNEQGVSVDLIRFRAYQVNNGQILVNFSRLYPVPSIEDFTIGRRLPSESTGAVLPGAPWELASLRQLAEQGNDATIAMLDLCAADEANGVTVQDIATQADITVAQVRGQLAGLTMRLKNPKYKFAQTAWPSTVQWQSGGVALYRMSDELIPLWRKARETEVVGPSQNPPGAVSSPDL